MNALPQIQRPAPPDGLGAAADSREANAGSGVLLTVREVQQLLGHSDAAITRRDIRRGRFGDPAGLARAENGTYLVPLDALPPAAQDRYWREQGDAGAETSARDADMATLQAAPAWARAKAEKYLAILQYCDGWQGEGLAAAVAAWNAGHPDRTTSLSRVYEARRAYQEQGVTGLLARYGQRKGVTRIRDAWMRDFEAVYLSQDNRSANVAWTYAHGCAVRRGDVEGFPASPSTFLRRLLATRGRSAIALARLGPSKHNRKFGPYIARDYSGIACGAVWVFDHAQVDVRVKGPDGHPVIPWVTAVLDMKSDKLLAWDLHPEPPNSDHIFQATYYALRDHGVPDHFYIDNGKDFRVRDFSGGKSSRHSLQVDEMRARSVAQALGIQVHFALPYNAQAKRIERRFRVMHGWFDKLMPGYRGSNVVERPEKLREEERAGRLMDWDTFAEAFGQFVTEVLNRLPSKGKVLRGLSPDQYWAAHATMRPRLPQEHLGYLCSRVSGEYRVGRNGVTVQGLAYWHEALVAMQGEKVYLRRESRSWQHAWIHRADNDELVCRATLSTLTPALAMGDAERKELKTALAWQRRVRKITAGMAAAPALPTPQEIMTAIATVTAPVPEMDTSAAPRKLTAADRVLAKLRQHQKGNAETVIAAAPEALPSKVGNWWDD